MHSCRQATSTITEMTAVHPVRFFDVLKQFGQSYTMLVMVGFSCNGGGGRQWGPLGSRTDLSRRAELGGFDDTFNKSAEMFTLRFLSTQRGGAELFEPLRSGPEHEQRNAPLHENIVLHKRRSAPLRGVSNPYNRFVME